MKKKETYRSDRSGGAFCADCSIQVYEPGEAGRPFCPTCKKGLRLGTLPLKLTPLEELLAAVALPAMITETVVSAFKGDPPTLINNAGIYGSKKSPILLPGREAGEPVLIGINLPIQFAIKLVEAFRKAKATPLGKGLEAKIGDSFGVKIDRMNHQAEGSRPGAPPS